MFKQKVFIEFLIDGVIKIDYDQKDDAVKSLTELLNNALRSKELIKIDTNITVLSEQDIMFALNVDSMFEEN